MYKSIKYGSEKDLCKLSILSIIRLTLLFTFQQLYWRLAGAGYSWIAARKEVEFIPYPYSTPQCIEYEKEEIIGTG